GDLGARIGYAFGRGLARGAPAVLIGSDTPDLPRWILAAAFAIAAQGELVLGPATDGGFYLIAGLKMPEGLFDGIAWSTSGVRDDGGARSRCDDSRPGGAVPRGDEPLQPALHDLPAVVGHARRQRRPHSRPDHRAPCADAKHPPGRAPRHRRANAQPAARGDR